MAGVAEKQDPRPWQNTVESALLASVGKTWNGLGNGLADTSMGQTSPRPLQVDYGPIREV